MKNSINKNLLLITLLFIGEQKFYSQGFVNLNFESAVIVPQGAPFLVLASKAIPGWTNGFPSGATIVYDTVSLGAAEVSIHDTNDPDGNTPLAGRYSVLLQGQFPGTQGASIAQTGQIPPNSQSLTLIGVLGSFQVTFNGQVIPLIGIGSGLNYTIYGGDISAFAGQTGELRFTAPGNGAGMFDNIQFSTQPIPEPSGLALIGMGAFLLGFFRRKAAR